ncbi:unnamed protein product [Heligmosomoides polygyrus]|uniref:Secreted protein n=1 Tax=Heligmosomoides polygyrus TaxID=6339 RepID=A0A183GMR8_HELPZ|nr:unnamed protein product [Heligmosomoides polygyrus]
MHARRPSLHHGKLLGLTGTTEVDGTPQTSETRQRALVLLLLQLKLLLMEYGNVDHRGSTVDDCPEPDYGSAR